VANPPIGRYPSAAVFVPIGPNLQTTTIYNWNLGIQRQFTPKLFAQIGYVGSHTVHIFDNVELNPPQILPVPSVAANDPRCTATTLAVNCLTNINARRLLSLANPVAASGFSELTAFDSGATSGYNGMILAANWRATNNVSFVGNYTWSHCIGPSNNAGGGTANPGTNYPHQYDRNLDVGNCSSDRRNVFNLTVVASTPSFSNKAMRLVLTDWQVSGIYRYSSGAPFSIASGVDNALLAYSERAVQVNQNTAATNQGQACVNSAPCVAWLNPAAFAQPALGTLSSLGVFNVLGPRFFQFDVALVRTFPVREKMNLQFRAEAFNLLNNVRFNNPGASLSSTSTFGNITSAQDPRILQLAMKFTL
jgi:hypothetical protein